MSISLYNPHGFSDIYMEDEPDVSTNTEISITVKSNTGTSTVEDESDSHADEVKTVEDTGAELFKDVHRLYTFASLIKHDNLDPSIYSFMNKDNQLSKLLKIKLPAVESLSTTGSNMTLSNNIMNSLDKYSKDTLSITAVKWFELLNKKLSKLESTIDRLNALRYNEISRLISRLEDDTTIKEEATISTDSEESESVENDENKDREYVEGVKYTEEDEEPIEDDTVDESTDIENNDNDNNKTNDTVKVNVNVNTTDETEATLKALSILNMKQTALYTNMDDACNGSYAALENIARHVQSIMKSVYSYNFNACKNRTFKITKKELIHALKLYRNILDNWNRISMCFNACSKMSKTSDNVYIHGIESFNKILPIYKSMSMTSTYIRTVKHAMDRTYHNLKYLTIKLIHTNRSI